MKGEADIVAHVTAATGVAEQEARRVIDAVLGFLSASAVAGEEVTHPSLGSIRTRKRPDGKTVWRLAPAGAPKPERPAKPAGGGGKAGGGKAEGRKAGGGGKGAGRGAGGKARRRGGRGGAGQG